MDEKDFFERFSAHLEHTRDDYELENIHDALIVWFGENYLLIDPDEVKERIVEDSRAEGVDSILIDKNNYKLIFIQAQTVNDFNNTSRNYPESDVKNTLTGIKFLLKGDYKKQITPNLEDLIDEYHEFDKTGNYKTKVIFLIFKKPPTSDKFVQDFKREFPTIEVEFIDFAKLLNIYKDTLTKTAEPPESISFKILTTVLIKDDPFKSRVFTSKGEEIAKIYNDFKERIFQRNVRYSLGMGERSINERILKTATHDTENDKFWYFNNGLTIVCDEIIPTTSGKIINLKRAQIINGAQTTYALFDAYQKGTLKENVEVLIKAVESVDKGFIDSITLYTNSQNAIRQRDLLSNLEIQVEVQKILSGTYRYFYERKRGEFDTLYPTPEAKKKQLGTNYKDRIISNEYAAQAFLALYLDRPSQAKSEKWKIFLKESGYFDEIFNPRDGVLSEKLLLAWKLLKYIELRKRDYRKVYNSAVKKYADKRYDELSNDEKLELGKVYRFSFLFHSEFFILNLFKDYFPKEKKLNVNGSKSEISRLINIVDNDDKAMTAIFNNIRDEIAYAIDELGEKPGFLPHKFFKKETSIGLIRNILNRRNDFVKIFD